jgi:hypothetical protein
MKIRGRFANMAACESLDFHDLLGMAKLQDPVVRPLNTVLYSGWQE